VGASGEISPAHVQVRGASSIYAGEKRKPPHHAANSIALAVTDHGRSQEVFALLTGELLFVGDVGRNDRVERGSENRLNSRKGIA